MGIDWNYLFTNTDGRIGRRTYWVGILAILALQALSYLLFGGGLVGIVARFIITLVGLAVMIKRCHDIGYTGWLSLISFIPFIGTFFIIGLGLVPGQTSANSYGANPDAPVGHAPTTPVDHGYAGTAASPVAGRAAEDAVVVDTEPRAPRRDI